MKTTSLGRTIQAIACVGVVIEGILSPPPAIAQVTESQESVCSDNTPAVFHTCALQAAKGFDPPRTPDGRPDMGGIWHLQSRAHEDLQEHPESLDNSGGPSAIVDPSDGRVPLQPWAETRGRENAQKYIDPGAACLLSPMPHTLTGARQFLQTPDYFVVLGARAHYYRIVPLNESPPVGEDIRLWKGVSRGRWEGNTLVIETTNYNAMSWLDQRARFYTQDMQVVERLTLIEPDTIHYQATVDDPNVYTRPFTIALAYRRSTVDGYEMSVEACYENNETLLEVYRSAGITLYPGISVEEAREAMEAAGPDP
jgi:hypothetical protein